MMRFLADEDFNNDVLRGVLRRLPELDVVRVQDVGLMTVDDSIILAWAAQEDRVVLTHDASTMIDAAYQRMREGLPMPGLVAAKRLAPLAVSISDIVLMAQAGTPSDFLDQVGISLSDSVPTEFPAYESRLRRSIGCIIDSHVRRHHRPD